MVDIFYRNKGIAVPIKECDTIKIDDKIITFIREFTEQNLDDSIEINFVRSNNLKNEILLDDRVNYEYKENSERLNQTIGRVFKEKGICYVALWPKFNQLIYYTFHELFHFIDLFDTNIEISREIRPGIHKVDFSKQIIKNVRLMINELFATSRAVEVLILLKNNAELTYSMLENDLLIGLEGVINDFKRNLKKVNNLVEFGDFRVFLINIFFQNFIQFIIYYLGAWYKFKKHKIDFDEFRECWDQFVDYIRDNIDHNLANFLTILKEQILKEWKYTDKIMIKYFEFEFIKYLVENDKNQYLYNYWRNLP